MDIQEAKNAELQEIMSFYNMMCEELGKKDFLPEGNKGGFPSLDMVVSAIKNRELYIGKEDGIIMAAYIMNNDADPVYDTVKWQLNVPKEQASVLHALRVHPSFGGKGYASQLVVHSIEMAKKKGQKVIRLDCIEGNSVPHRMYHNHGFQYIDTVEICYEDIGMPRKFLLFERVL
ncbi:GNAT family N-acetyltransferase [Lachnospiraceae bacterium]|nr:GNAT family N-acetyltransferase [Lachnospiraceae bacterium]